MKTCDGIVADCRLLPSRDLFLGEAMLTGETYPVEKHAGDLPSEIPLAQRSNSLFQGTHVISGSGTAVVAQVGDATVLGGISNCLQWPAPETDFERGVRRFGYFLVEVTLLLMVTIFAINVFLHEPVLETFLFALALAVGLTPQLLPAIISVNLSHGARRMAKRDVIVRRLSAIENLGSMDVLCCDKTGTLTEGVVRIREATDGLGTSSHKTLLFARINAYFESGFANPIDEAIRGLGDQGLQHYRKRDEVPYDFIRKRLSLLVEHRDQTLLITKGAVDNVLAVCTTAELADGRQAPLIESAAAIQEKYKAMGDAGFRRLGIAYRDMPPGEFASKDSEQRMVFLGFLVLHDPPKQDVADTIETLRGLGVGLKNITGDNRRVATSVAKQIGLSHAHLVTGEGLPMVASHGIPVVLSRPQSKKPRAKYS
ncbi:MAG: HAD-IC family P-type ATPase [Planctomycetales bacterium]|nr:HAD-IC family P-type ATPase [Planctomycetales bacterium]